MIKQETIDAGLLLMKQVAEDAQIAVNKLIEESDINTLYQSADDLIGQAHKIYRIVAQMEALYYLNRKKHP